MRSLARTLTVLTLIAAGACHPTGGNVRLPPPAAVDQGLGPVGDAVVQAGDAGIRPGADLATTGGTARVGIVVIDAQESFIQWAANPDIKAIIENIRSVLTLAGTQQVPLFITYEASKDVSSGSAMPAALRAAAPAHTQEFIKTTFAATGLPAFAKAVQHAARTHLIVVGAETDVCVLQTVLGLRELGYTVILQRDAVFTSEPNTAPALRRMEQAGVLMASMAQVKAYLEGTSPLPSPAATTPIRIIEPTSIAVVLDELQDASVGASQDKNKTAKIARLRELLLISEWFDIPLYGSTAALPAQLTGLITKPIQPLSGLVQSPVTQLVFAGTDKNLPTLISSYGASRDVFLLEDGLLAVGPAAQSTSLEQHYQAGAVPLTYKSMYYGMTKSVDLAEWPKAWADRDPIYYPKTQAPEALPPIVE